MRLLSLQLDSDEDAPPSLKLIPSAINVSVLITLSFIYKKVAFVLVDLENHRYQNEYEDSLSVKIYLFEFFNVYMSNFMIAFWYKDFT